MNALGQVVCTSTGPSTAGIHRVQWTLVAPGTAPQAAGGRGGGGGGAGGGAGGPPDPSCSGGGGGGRGGNNVAQAPPGTYNVKLTVNGREYTKPVVVLEDVWLHER